MRKILVLLVVIAITILPKIKLLAETSPVIMLEPEVNDEMTYSDYVDSMEKIMTVIEEYDQDDRILYSDFAIHKNMYTHNFESNAPESSLFKSGLEVRDDKGNLLYKRTGGVVDYSAFKKHLNTESWTLINEFNTEFVGVNKGTFYDLISGNVRIHDSDGIDNFHDDLVCLVNKLHSSYVRDDGTVGYPKIGDVIKSAAFIIDERGQLKDIMECNFTIVGFYSSEEKNCVYVPLESLIKFQREIEFYCREHGYYLYSDTWAENFYEYIHDDLEYISEKYISSHEKNDIYQRHYYRNSCLNYEYGVLYPVSPEKCWNIVSEIERELSLENVKVEIHGEKEKNTLWFMPYMMVIFISVLIGYILIGNKDRKQQA